MVYARFDDLTPGEEHAFELTGLEDVVVAQESGQVRSALRAVNEAASRGAWAAGYVAYEAATGCDTALSAVAADYEMPCVWFGIFRRRRPVSPFAPRIVRPAPYHISAWRTGVDRGGHAAAIEQIRRYIEDGETYQVNFTFRLAASFSGDPHELYRDLVLAQRGAFGVHLATGRYHIVSASPELFFSRNGPRIEVRPMKGTIGRGRWPEEDRANAHQLTRSLKDRAENLMIVDLLRNDLGRIARFGTVQVDELLALERYETVWQLTSRISAEVPDEVGLEEIFAALFPSGSVTGAPKPRTTQIITELECTPRGVYCGAIGYVAPGENGSPPRSTFNVAIRTVTIDTSEGTAEYGVGGGITWDSLSDPEYEEARLKAMLLVERRPEFCLIETMRWEPEGGYVLRDGHLARLRESAEYFGFRFPAIEIHAALEEVVFGETEAQRVRLLLGRDGEFDAAAVPLPVPMGRPFADEGDPVRFVIGDDPVGSQNVFLFHKTSRREMYDERLKQHPSADDVLLVNERGEITEFTIGNVAVEIDDVWYTPPIECGLLGGVLRNRLVARGELSERVIDLEELGGANRVAFLNSVRGWRCAELLE